MKVQMKANTLAPDFELTDTQGRQIHLADYRGKALVLVLMRGFA